MDGCMDGRMDRERERGIHAWMGAGREGGRTGWMDETCLAAPSAFGMLVSSFSPSASREHSPTLNSCKAVELEAPTSPSTRKDRRNLADRCTVTDEFSEYRLRRLLPERLLVSPSPAYTCHNHGFVVVIAAHASAPVVSWSAIQNVQ